MKKVLIVDDVQGWRDYHSQIVSEIYPQANIITADCARKAYDLIMENNDTPFDLIITDMQMESDFEPKYAGEWFVEQIKTFKNYSKTKIIVCSATFNIRQIAEQLGVECIPKSTALKFPTAYEIIK